jgi:hypothetical protein
MREEDGSRIARIPLFAKTQRMGIGLETNNRKNNGKYRDPSLRSGWRRKNWMMTEK